MKLKLRPNMKQRVQAVKRALELPLLPLILIVLATHALSLASSDPHPPRAASPVPTDAVGGGPRTSAVAKAEPEGAATEAAPKPGHEVTELHLTSDFRAVKLRWRYEHTAANEPAAFAVRYCELTSWNIEIKCRQRDLEVEAGAEFSRRNPNAVIEAPHMDTVHQLESPGKSLYEAHIYDLRALTNYTFQVRVGRFSHEQPPAAGAQERRQRNQSVARRLSLDESALFADSLARRVETKPFGAEATKCLADVSEVIVNTGRYFGGRISVEDSNDARCHLLGNKSSEQTSYLFRIDHELCGSKPVGDGKRIGTMVLVHENKDILTHNTARFLVLCNFLQKSFTLRASISLPKVNGMVAQSRSAVITSLPRKPTNNTAEPAEIGARSEELQLRAEHLSKAKPADANGTAARAKLPQQLDELETNTIEKRLTSSPSQPEARQSKELHQATASRRSSSAQDARSLTLSSGAAGKLVPQPVQVQSKVLYVERTEPSRVGRLQSDALGLGGGGNNWIAPYPLAAQRSSQIDTSTPDGKLAPEEATSERETSSARNASTPTSTPKPIRAEANRSDELSIIMTNNHRIAGDFLPVAQLGASSPNRRNSNNGDGLHNYSIKYSAARVDEYPIGRADERFPQLSSELTQQAVRARSGRMRPIESEPSSASSEPPVLPGSRREPPVSPASLRERPAWSVDDRMGEALAGAEADIAADSSNETSSQVALNQTLAQNITGYLLKWSLKALSNLAKKSLESLAPPEDQEATSELNSSTAEPPASGNAPPEVREVSPPATTKSPSKRPVPATQAPASTSVPKSAKATNVTSTAPSSQLAHPPKPPTSGESRTQDALLDGFLTSGKRLEGERAERQTQAQPSNNLAAPAELPPSLRPHPTRPSNYSKSLDLSRNESLRQSNSERGKVNASARHRTSQVNEDVGLMGTAKESATDGKPREATFAGWPFYGVVLIVAVALGIFLTFWLVSLPPKPRASRLEQNINAALHPIAFNDPGPAVLLFNGPGGGSAAAPGKSGQDIISYERYDYNKFENTYNPQHMRKDSSNLFTAAKVNLPSSQKSPSTSSQSTRSTSLNSTILAGDGLENDCKHNEFLYTEHVLINPESSFGESYA